MDLGSIKGGKGIRKKSYGGGGYRQKLSACKDKRRSRGEKVLHCVKEEISRWKEKEVRGVKRRRVFDEI